MNGRRWFLVGIAIVGLAAGHLLGVIHAEMVELAVAGAILSLVVWSVGGVGVSLLSVILAHQRTRPERAQSQARISAHVDDYSVDTRSRARRETV